MKNEILEEESFLHSKNSVLLFSGGTDSVYLLNKLLEEGQKPTLIQINYTKLLKKFELSDDSDLGSKITKEWALKYDLNYKIINCIIPEKINNLEAYMRDFRYQKAIDYLKNNNIKKLYTAHNMNDRFETMLIAFSRGSGLAGLSNMSEIENKVKNGFHYIHLRPLINTEKQTIIDFLSNNLTILKDYYVDPTNLNPEFLRNELRPFVSDFISKHKNGIKNSFKRLEQEKKILLLRMVILKKNFIYLI